MSGKRPYLGPAGIFSTDDPGMDQAQIEAEQWDGDESGFYSEESDFEDEEKPHDDPYNKLFVVCNHLAWWEEVIILESDLEGAKENFRKKHKKECACGKDDLVFEETLL